MFSFYVFIFFVFDSCQYYFVIYFVFHDTSTTEIYTILFVGSVRCVQETDSIQTIPQLVQQNMPLNIILLYYRDGSFQYMNSQHGCNCMNRSQVKQNLGSRVEVRFEKKKQCL
eukprot:TRINITY_DN30345_c0_g1_i1.p1 TRINITY_DN30345_c0_g1~~TRINITY_DN30345_c0_g1_i1.p1  ORF type:complete len:113 (+),score=2.88 TRINITY_DN30345_c0_g1_i1:3-341(+)